MDRHPMGRCAALVLAAMLPAAGAQAQIEGMLGKGSGAGGLAGMGGMTSNSMGNVAGLLQYCIGNNYLSGEGAASVKDKLMGKLPGGTPSADRGYTDGQKGLLHGSNGKLLDLGGGASGEGAEGGEGGDVGASEGGRGVAGAVAGVAGGTGGTGGLTADLKKKVCDTVLAQAKSFL
jgi:hypothetical protein